MTRRELIAAVAAAEGISIKELQAVETCVQAYIECDSNIAHRMNICLSIIVNDYIGT